MARNCYRKMSLTLNVLSVEIIQEVRILFCCILSQYWTKKQWSPLVQILIPSWHITFYTEIMCAYMCVCVWKFCKEYFFLFVYWGMKCSPQARISWLYVCVCPVFIWKYSCYLASRSLRDISLSTFRQEGHECCHALPITFGCSHVPPFFIHCLCVNVALSGSPSYTRPNQLWLLPDTAGQYLPSFVILHPSFPYCFVERDCSMFNKCR